MIGEVDVAYTHAEDADDFVYDVWFKVPRDLEYYRRIIDYVAALVESRTHLVDVVVEYGNTMLVSLS